MRSLHSAGRVPIPSRASLSVLRSPLPLQGPPGPSMGGLRPPEAFPEGSESQSGSISTLPCLCREDTTPRGQVHFAASVASGMSRLFGVAMEKLGPVVV